jgi:hypothetical protein
MTNVNIELPEAVHKKLKLRAVEEGKTLQQLLVETLQRRNT